MNKFLTIGHLYPDLMNIYGDRGNIIALSKRLIWRGIDVNVLNISIGDKITPGMVDIYFFGGGQDKSQIAAAADLKTKAEIIRQDIEEGVVALTVCGGYQLFGKRYIDQSGEILEGIGIFNATTKAGKLRMIGNVMIEMESIIPGTRLIGFENHSGQTFLGDGAVPLGKVISGYGNNGEDKTEGVVYKNAIGTYLHGSLLPKNPTLTDLLLEKALSRKYQEFSLEPLDDKVEEAAFAEAKTRFE